MPRHARMRITPTALDELFGFFRDKTSFRVVEHPLPDDIRFVRGSRAENGVYTLIVASDTFADAPATDLPEVKVPRLEATRVLHG